MHHSGSLIPFTLLCNHHPIISRAFHLPKQTLCPHWTLPSTPLPPAALLLSISMDLIPLGPHISGIVQSLSFCDWIISLAPSFLKIHLMGMERYLGRNFSWALSGCYSAFHPQCWQVSHQGTVSSYTHPLSTSVPLAFSRGTQMGLDLSLQLSNWSQVKRKWKCWSLSHVRLLATPWTIVHQAPLSLEISRQEYWNGLPFPSPGGLPDPRIKSRFPA